MAKYLVADAVAYANFRRYAVHVWKRHLQALNEEMKRLG